MQAEASHHFAPPETDYAQGSTVNILENLFSFQRDFKES
jgi:hypothetical protein